MIREPSDEVPGVAVIMHQLSSSDSVKLFVDSIRVYSEMVYLRIGLKFRDPESWREAGISPSVLMMSDTFNATTRYQDGEIVPSFNYKTDALSTTSFRAMAQISSRGAGLQWYVDYVISPFPAGDVVFSAGVPRIGLGRGEWLLSESAVEKCLQVGSRYASARKAAEEAGGKIRTNLNNIAEIVARLAHLGANVDFGNAKMGWEPTVQVPLEKGGILSIHEILSDDAINVTLRGLKAECYLLDVSDDPGMQVIALSNDVTGAAEVLIAGLHRPRRQEFASRSRPGHESGSE
jgi:hypothetical protein